MLHAMLMPSKVLVPRPISSSTIRLRLLILLIMLAVSFISTINVLSPPLKLSEAPTRVNILSVCGMMAFCAGTKLPACAINVISTVCLSKALLPLIFGPVMMMICCSSLSSITVLATYSSPTGKLRSMTGCRPFSICKAYSSVTTGRRYLYCTALLAKHVIQSSCAIRLAFN